MNVKYVRKSVPQNQLQKACNIFSQISRFVSMETQTFQLIHNQSHQLEGPTKHTTQQSIDHS